MDARVVAAIVVIPVAFLLGSVFASRPDQSVRLAQLERESVQSRSDNDRLLQVIAELRADINRRARIEATRPRDESENTVPAPKETDSDGSGNPTEQLASALRERDRQAFLQAAAALLAEGDAEFATLFELLEAYVLDNPNDPTAQQLRDMLAERGGQLLLLEFASGHRQELAQFFKFVVEQPDIEPAVLGVALRFMTNDNYGFVDHAQSQAWLHEAKEDFGDDLYRTVAGNILYGHWLKVASADSLWELYAQTADRGQKWRILSLLMDEKGERGKEELMVELVHGIRLAKFKNPLRQMAVDDSYSQRVIDQLAKRALRPTLLPDQEAEMIGTILNHQSIGAKRAFIDRITANYAERTYAERVAVLSILTYLGGDLSHQARERLLGHKTGK